MNRLIVCLVAVALSSLVVESALAGHGRRVVRVHHVGRAHVVHRVPVVHHPVVRVVPHHHHHHYVPRVYHAPHVYQHSTLAYPAYGRAVVHSYGYPARVYVGGPVISLSIGF